MKAALLVLAIFAPAVAKRESLEVDDATMQNNQLEIRIASELTRAAANVSSSAVVAHAVALAQRQNLGFNEQEVKEILEKNPSFMQTVSEHFVAARADKEYEENEEIVQANQDRLATMRAALLQKARGVVSQEQAKSLDSSLGGKTSCTCFMVAGHGMRIADLDNEGTFNNQMHCSRRCIAMCHSENKYKFDPHEAQSIGAEGVQQSMAAAKCERGQCSCLDADQTVRRAGGRGWDIANSVQVHESPSRCFRGCARQCDSYDGYNGGDWEGLCMDEWDRGLAREIQTLARE